MTHRAKVRGKLSFMSICLPGHVPLIFGKGWFWMLWSLIWQLVPIKEVEFTGEKHRPKVSWSLKPSGIFCLFEWMSWKTKGSRVIFVSWRQFFFKIQFKNPYHPCLSSTYLYFFCPTSKLINAEGGLWHMGKDRETEYAPNLNYLLSAN